MWKRQRTSKSSCSSAKMKSRLWKAINFFSPGSPICDIYTHPFPQRYLTWYPFQMAYVGDWLKRGVHHSRLALLDLSCFVRSGKALRDRIKHLSDMISLSKVKASTLLTPSTRYSSVQESYRCVSLLLIFWVKYCLIKETEKKIDNLR